MLGKFRDFVYRKLNNAKTVAKILGIVLFGLGAFSQSDAYNIALRAAEHNKNAIVATDERPTPSSLKDSILEIIKNDPKIQGQVSDIPEKEVEKVVEETIKKEISIPQSISQAGYSATGYNETGIPRISKKGLMMDSSKEWHEGTNQRDLHSRWVQAGKNYTNGIASLKINGKNRYLIALTDTFGKVGDLIDFEFGNGERIKCIIADTKDRKDDNWNKYGHMYKTPSGKFQTNIIEFEVNPEVYNMSKTQSGNGNPTTKIWGLPWKDYLQNKKGESYRNKIVKAYNYGNYKEI